MATPVIMPRQGQSVESCIISKWYKKKGDSVKVGDLLFNYETDKATFDEESKVEGTLLDIFFEEGDEVAVLTNVCVIGKPGESTAEFNPNAGTSKSAETSKMGTVPNENPAVADVSTATNEPPVARDSDGRLKISPRAENLASKKGVDPRYANPTGPGGRIIERDINALNEQGPSATKAAAEEFGTMPAGSYIEGTGIGGKITTGDIADVKASGAAAGMNVGGQTAKGDAQQYEVHGDFERVKLTNIRKVIAKAMHNSLSNSAQLTLNASFDVTDIINYRKKLKNKKKSPEENITINDIIIFVVSRTILGHKDINAHFLGDEMLLFKNAQIGMAVDTDRGLMVPTIFDANEKSLREISAEAKALVNDCRKGTISPDALKGGSFTITNLGTLGIESFTPVINPPQTGILGVDNISIKVKEINEQYLYYPAMGLSLTFDHRAIDGAPAARFLQELTKNLENFSILYSKSIK